ncbi:MAG: hypothetical protein HGB10_09510 [Coriobacteriia bacterium]|nr:hypothetical protein [Coriobacteriia bacterium]
MRIRTITLLLLVTLGLLALSGCTQGTTAGEQRGDAARATATGFVAAVAKRDAAAIAGYMGRTPSDSEIAAMAASVPETLGTDPGLYTARTPGNENLTRRGVATIVVSPASSEASTPMSFSVHLQWEPSATKWQVIKMVPDK